MEQSARSMNRVLIVKMSSIGDIAHALPVVATIKQHRPDLFIGWVVKQRCATLLQGNPIIDKLYVVSDKPSLRELYALSQKMLADRYDTALEMQGLLLSGIVALLSGAKRRIGLDRNREGNFLFLTDHSVPGRDKSRHAIDIQYGFARALGVPKTPDEVPVQGYLASGDAAFAEQALAGVSRPVVAFNAGASTMYKQWPAGHWAELGRLVAASGASIVLLGAKSDIDEVGKIESAIGAPVVNLAGKTNLRQLASVVARCDAMVSGDTGPMHIAVDVGTPCVALFGATAPKAYGPYGQKNVILWKGLPCSPCHRNPTCNGRVDCMKQILPSEVFDALNELVSKTPLLDRAAEAAAKN